MKRLSVLLATMVVAAAALDPRAALEPRAKAIPKEDPKMGTATSQGCFKSEGLLEDAKYLGVKYEGHEVSEGKCEEFARKQKQPVFAMKGEVCYLGKEYPPKDDGVDDSKCKSDCPGYPRDICGSYGEDGSFFSVWNTGIELDIQHSDPSASETSGSGSKDDKDDSGGPNVAGIAGGSVVGVVVLLGAVGAMFFYMRRKRNAEIEEEHRRNAAVNSFIGGGHSTGGSVTDARLEPIMAQRRMSDGSIKDNEDYSRRILRVTNV